MSDTLNNINDINEVSADKLQEIAADNTGKKPVTLYFNARDWNFHKAHQAIGERSFITDVLGGLSEAYCIGNWDWNGNNWTEIISKRVYFQKNQDYIFTFWLNGGENEHGNEVCQFHIIFNDGWENRYTYKLNRNYVKYTMHYNGWYLYEIPFNSGEYDFAEFMFAAFRAHCAILPALDKDAYKDLPEDEPIPGLPQRSNLVFSEGYPKNASWSWRVFGENAEPVRGGNQGGSNKNIFNFSGDAAKDFMNHISAGDIMSHIDFDEIAEEITDNIRDEIDIEALTEQFKGQIEKNIKNAINR